MKATNLMIGDLVLASGKPIHVTLATFNAGIDVKPILLTTEILEKNSFLKVEALVYNQPRIGITFLYRITPEGLRIFVQNACTGGPTCTMIKTCKYIHEVQHMIKMCDIEKEIIL